MGLEELQSGNTLRAKATAVATFKKFLKVEEVAEDYVTKYIESDESGKSVVSVMDKFGMYLAFNEGKKGKALARNTAMQYYRQAKLWLLDKFPQHRSSLEARLLKMGKTLDNFCMKRDGGGVVSKAPPCTKADLKKMVLYLYSNGCCETDYQDAALLRLLWYLFGRASDLSMLHKRNISINAGGVLFLGLIRLKTSEEQGLSLFPDTDFSTCPVLAIAIVLAVQAAPCVDLIGNLPQQVAQTKTKLTADIPLIALLNAPTISTTLAGPATKGADTASTIYAHVNRILSRVAPAAGVTGALSSHSFRRGGAQHANGFDKLTERWIFDRGSWNMSTTNKGFNYIFNTSKEDHKVAKVLAGYKPKVGVTLQNLSTFDFQTLGLIMGVQRVLLTASMKLDTTSFNVNQEVLDVLTAAKIRNFPLLRALNPEGLVVKRVESAIVHNGSQLADLLAWSSHLAHPPAKSKYTKPTTDKETKQASKNPPERTKEEQIIDHQAAVIEHLITLSKQQETRMDALEAKQNNDPVTTSKRDHPQDTQEAQDISTPKKKQRRAAVTPIHAVWFSWYAHDPRWQAAEPKRQGSKAKLLVAFMKLFLTDGFVLDPTGDGYRDQVLELGKRAEDGAMAYLVKHNIKSRGSSAVLKHLHTLHTAGALNTEIERHQRLLQTGAIQDPSPGYTQDVREVVSK